MANDNFLVIPLSEAQDILHYQIEMLHYNPQPGILPVQTRFNNQEISLYYQLGSRHPIIDRLRDMIISGEEVLLLLLRLVDILQDSKNLLLNPASFMLELSHIYINSHTWDVALIYLPLAPRLELKQSLLNLIDKLILTQPSQTSVCEEIQLISQYLHRDFVSLLQFRNFLTQLRLQGPPLRDPSKEKPFRLDKQKKQLGEKREKNTNILQENKVVKKKYQNISLKIRQLGFFILAQIVIALLLLGSSNFLNSLGNPMVTYLGLALLLGGINVLVLRKLFTTVPK